MAGAATDEAGLVSDQTGISWTDATWNPIVGCSLVSPGCSNCYAMRDAHRIVASGVTHYQGLVEKRHGKAVWTGKVALAPEAVLTKPLRWRRPRRIFVNSMGDLFHESVPDAWIDRVFAVMALAPQHQFQLLTKRAKRMRDYFADPDHAARWFRWIDDEWAMADRDLSFEKVTPNAFLSNVWLGVSAERQAEADERIPDLLATPAAVRFVSAEPLLGPIDFTTPQGWLWNYDERRLRAPVAGWSGQWVGCGGLDWIIVGGENGDRPMHPDWARQIRDQCAAAHVPFHLKQWGTHSLHELREGGELVPPIPASGDFARMRRWNGCEFRLAAKGESVGSFMQPGWFAVPSRKHAAGRLLDDVLHDAFPEPAP